MIAILETADPVRLHFLKTMLEEAGLQVFLFEAATPWPGAFPARLMVPEDEADLARRLIAQAEA
ncbi:MAG: putative prokaryotic signal transducing protein [Phenylobacterium sp.]|nr:putative prokaryotic signal transducing protein [Phenylobacterium sp.]